MSTGVAAPRTRVRWGAPPDEQFLHDVSVLFGRNGRTKPIDVLRWQYVDGVHGAATAVGLDGADGLGALYVTVPRRLVVDGRTVEAAQSLDVMTDEAWRGRGLFIRLATDTYRRLEAAGTAAVFGFPNAEAAPGFQASLGWEPLGSVPFLVRPLPASALAHRAGSRRSPDRPARSGGRLLPGIVSCDEVPEGIDGLWRRFARTLRVAVVRDAEYLEWRFARPASDYRMYAAYVKGRMVGFAAVTVTDRHGARIGYVLELLADPAHPRAGRQLLHQLARDAAARGADLLMAWNPPQAPTRPIFRWAGYVPLPDSARPIDLQVGCRVFDRRQAHLLPCLDPDAWYLSYLDSDTI